MEQDVENAMQVSVLYLERLGACIATVLTRLMETESVDEFFQQMYVDTFGRMAKRSREPVIETISVLVKYWAAGKLLAKLNIMVTDSVRVAKNEKNAY